MKGLIILKFREKLIHSKLVVIFVIALIIAPMNVYGMNHSTSITTKDLLPQYNNYNWTYTGFAEYGHDMSIERIVSNDTTTNYNINGSVHDMSGGEADTNLSIDLEYIVESDVLIQKKGEEAMMDSKYDSIELIRSPLEEGTTWNQSVENPNGDMTTLESSIKKVETQDNSLVFTVKYEDINSDYYEERKIKESIGVISFEKIMFNEGDSYTIGYSLYDETSGLSMKSDFQDVSNDAWYENYVDKLVTMDLIDGYPNDTFRPENEITVAEFIKITVETLSYYPEPGEDQWYTPYVSKAINLDLLEAGEFENYDRPIKRDEMTKIIVNALDEEPQQGTLDFSDAIDIEAEYRPYIYTAVELGLIAGYPSDNSFRAEENTSRAEASKLFVLLVEDHVTIKSFNGKDALALETAFRNRLFQETEDDSWVIKDFDSIAEVINHMAEITSRDVAETYVGNYYEYMNGELTLPPKDGPTRIIEDRDYQLEILHPRAYHITQETTTAMIGHYTLTITYHYSNNKWIMEERHVEVHENN